MSSFLRHLVLAVPALFLWSPLRAQQSSPLCTTVKYEHRNMIDYGPLRISAVSGSAKDSQGVATPNACVGVFSEQDHTLVATGKTDAGGFFEIANIPNGNYRLVVAFDGFCAANVSIVLRNRSRGKKKLVATMKPSEIDVCSYIEWK